MADQPSLPTEIVSLLASLDFFVVVEGFDDELTIMQAGRIAKKKCKSAVQTEACTAEIYTNQLKLFAHLLVPGVPAQLPRLRHVVCEVPLLGKMVQRLIARLRILPDTEDLTAGPFERLEKQCCKLTHVDSF